MTEAFLDSNVLLYLLSGDARKAERAEALVASGATISVQVLNEFANVAHRKFRMSVAEVRDFLETIRAICTVAAVTEAVHDRGMALAERYQLPIHDSMIAAAALESGCSTLWSEDFQDKMLLDKHLRVRNPFAH